MRQVAGLISTYSSDEFGICSALYELGGMVVMHDASGCNSTYTTHDEPRWYDMDSMIFISAISEAEAIMGDDDKFIQDLVETAGELQPKFIALVGAPIPYMIGTDLDAIAQIVSAETGIPCFGFAANGMHHYTTGISMALLRMVQEFTREAVESDRSITGEKTTPTVNLIGATPLDFAVNGSVASMQTWIEDNGMQCGVCLSMGCDLEGVGRLTEAQVNLVVSYGGLAAAEYMEQRYGIPYVVGVPYGSVFARELAKLVRQTAESKVSCVGYQVISEKSGSVKCPPQQAEYAIIGEGVCSASLATAIELEHPVKVQVLCPVDMDPKALREGDLMTPEEDDIMEAIASRTGVIADPLYQSLLEGQQFYAWPHEAFSGRIYDAVNPNLIGKLSE